MRYGSASEPWDLTQARSPLERPTTGAFRFTENGKIRPRRTVQSTAECMKTLHVRKDIWIPYHFLPGNYTNQRTPPHPKHILRKGSTNVNFRLLCRPFSPLAMAMIADLLAYNLDNSGADYNYLLQLIGLRMHVFADTWAHQDFVGDGVKAINDCLGHYNFIEKGESLEQLNWDIPIIEKDNNLGYAPNVQLPRAYLGHGRLGHFPDYSWCRYYYSPAWMQTGSSLNPNSNVKMLKRDNPVVFETAFFELVKVLHALKNKRRAYPNPTTLESILGSNSNEIINDVRGAITLDRSDDLYTDTLVFQKTVDKWNELIVKHCKVSLAQFDNDKWKREATETLDNPGRRSGDDYRWTPKFREGNLYKFNLASEHHFGFVKTKLRADLNYELDDLAFFDNSKVGLSSNVEWQPDSLVKKCPLCNRSFGTFLRKHHCRTCGRVVCSGCAPEKGLRRDRICIECAAPN